MATREPTSSVSTEEILEDSKVEADIKEALDCPCVKDLKEGPCGSFFVAAFQCYHRSQDVIKGADCFSQNVGFADCLAAHPDVADAMKNGDSPPGPVPVLPPEHLRLDIAAGGSS